eukprot:CAMPEP_0195530966 /NCGR_PEP_ID=MMETSP0794_2-20130614/34093_1 /TAXON_ID=515487 /ORGANISM="Stephanopyxis turris, Strain CCMP 815" /LENGTH=166 /DNA_ID=CAMNT_0040662595 /DNA_START=74 /DNA_END=574 /DNA_ORIENTATION=-
MDPKVDDKIVAGEETKVDQYDVGQHVYESSKKLWAFGKGVFFFKPFLNITEGVASKLLGLTTGMELTDVDQKFVKPALAGLDESFLNPSISKVVHVILPYYMKTDQTIRPIVEEIAPKVLKPLDALRGEKKDDNEEETEGKDEKKPTKLTKSAVPEGEKPPVALVQ